MRLIIVCLAFIASLQLASTHAFVDANRDESAGKYNFGDYFTSFENRKARDSFDQTPLQIVCLTTQMSCSESETNEKYYVRLTSKQTLCRYRFKVVITENI